MKIPFMLKFPWGEETYFIEKLWAMAMARKQEYFHCLEFYYYKGFSNGIVPIQMYDGFAPKLHTIRNKSDRFKIGQKVQPFVWTYKPYRRNPNSLIPAQFDFIPPLRIVSKQTFEISYIRNNKYPTLPQLLPIVVVDGSHLYNPLLNIDKGMLQFALNDGFNSMDHFFRYFNKPVENMEIRHFTNLKY